MTDVADRHLADAAAADMLRACQGLSASDAATVMQAAVRSASMQAATMRRDAGSARSHYLARLRDGWRADAR